MILFVAMQQREWPSVHAAKRSLVLRSWVFDQPSLEEKPILHEWVNIQFSEKFRGTDCLVDDQEGETAAI